MRTEIKTDPSTERLPGWLHWLGRHMDSMQTQNEQAAQWWAERWIPDGTREAFKAALLERLPDGDWKLESDYDPSGILLEAVQSVAECTGSMFSSDDLLPRKTWMARAAGTITYSAGYGAPIEVMKPAVPTVEVSRRANGEQS